MSKLLHLSPDLRLPLEAVTQTFAILAMRGVGKTHTASVMAEEFCEARLPFAVLDPTGAWWGLRSSADGKGEGYPVTILGGDHADAPLEEGAGKVVADMLAEEAPPLVLDMSAMSKGSMRRFVADFAERLYEKNREPLHLIIDEADAFAPQRPRPDEMRMLGALDDIVRRGRIRGLGCTLVTQRSAVINKDVLTQTEVLVVLRTAHPRDRAPVLEWMKVHATPEQLAEVEASLAKLPKGDAWVMSAGWLDLFQHVHIRERGTFNSSATPKPGERRVAPRAFARIDPAVLERRLAAAIEKARASDPKLLARRVAELERELAGARAARPSAPAKRVEVPVLAEGQVKRLEALFERVTRTAGALTEASSALTAHMGELAGRILSFRSATRAVAAPASVAPPKAPRTEAAPTGELPPAALRVLTAAASLPQPVSRKQLATVSGYRPKGGGFNNLLGALRSRGLLAGRDAMTVTEAGLALVDPEVLRPKSADELRELWKGKLPPAHWRVLEVLITAHPEALPKAAVAERAGYQPDGGGFNNIVGSLSSAALVERSAGGLRASDAIGGQL